MISVLWTSDRALVVDKTPGVLVHNSAWAGPREETVTSLLRAQLGVPVVPMHRLDRGTSGVCAFAVAAEHVSCVRLGATKAYVALVRGRPAQPVDIEHGLDDDDVKGSPRRAARSRLEPLLSSSVERVSVVGLVLFSGRRHQARRHCKHVSHPIVGDATHGKGALNRDLRDRYGLSRLCLHAAALSIDDAAGEARPSPPTGVIVRAPLPNDWHAPLAALFPGDDVAAVVDRWLTQWSAALSTSLPDEPEGNDDAQEHAG